MTLPPIPRRRLVVPALRVAVGKALIEVLDARPLVTLLHDLPAALGARLDITVAVVPLPVCHQTLRQFDHVIASWCQLTHTGSQHRRTAEPLGHAHPGS